MRKALYVMLMSAVAAAGTVTHSVRFSLTELRFSTWNGFDVVELGRGHSLVEPGRPTLPVVNVTLAMPATAVVTDVAVEPVAKVVVGGRYNVAPQQRPTPISKPAPGTFVPPEPAVYTSDAPWPPDVVRGWGSGRATGYRLASVAVCPLQYHPASGQLTLFTELRLRVSYDNTGSSSVLAPGQIAVARSGLRDLVDNPDELDRFAPVGTPSDQPEVQYLVVTADRLAPDLEPYIAYKRTRGIRTELRTVEWVDRNYSGRDMQERLRNCIRDFYERRGLCYVLLAGDNAEVPSRRIRLSVFDEQGDIPTDLYYGDLDWSWDSNHNNLFGEMDDTVDLYADVLVGRASIQSPAQAATLLDKVQRYEQDPETDHLKRALLPSGWLWQSIGYHGRFMNDSIANITPSDWIDRSLVNPSGALVVADSFEHGFAIFDPAGHGNSGGVYNENGTPIYTSGVAGLQRNDGRFAIMTSLACDPGDFEAEDCLAEASHNCQDGGSIAVVMNSRYGWGTPPSIGPSELLCIRFYDFLLQRDAWNLGACHDRSREEYAQSAQWSDLWRWCVTEFNLFGDPTLDVWTEQPSDLTVSAPDTIPTGEQTLDVSVLDSGSPAPGLLVCASDGGDLLAVDTTDAAGSAALPIHPTRPGSLSIRAVGHNYLPGAREVAVVQGAPEPDIVLRRVSVDDEGAARPNGMLEPGETGRLALAFRNVGRAEATGTVVLVRTNTPGMALVDSTAALGTIAPGDTARADEMVIACGTEVNPGSNPEFIAHVTSTEGTWDVEFAIAIGYPGRLSAEIDTGACALTATGRGSIGFDRENGRAGRGFRYPKHDTSCLNIASFALGSSGDYVVDRFYTNADALDRDWSLVDSVRQILPLWGADEMLEASFSDAGHGWPADVHVLQRAFAMADSSLDGFCVLVYDVWNMGTSAIEALYAGILADFDVKATDRLHDLAGTLPELNSAYMRSVEPGSRIYGLKLLAPAGAGHVTCVDHARFVYPDSGLSDGMKLRALQGILGSERSDRPYNWSVAVGSGPFDLAPNGGRKRLAFAFIAAEDSASYVGTCRASQQWYEANVGVGEPNSTGPGTPVPRFSLRPTTFARTTAVRCDVSRPTSVLIRAFDASGRLAEVVHSGTVQPGQIVRWSPADAPAGAYVVRVTAGADDLMLRAVVVR